MVFTIAFIPALAVFIVSYWTDSKGWTIAAAVAAGLLGVLTGNPAYAGVDLLFAGLGYWVSMGLLKERLKAKSIKQARLDWVAEREAAEQADFKERCASWDAAQAKKVEARKAQLAAALAQAKANAVPTAGEI